MKTLLLLYLMMVYGRDLLVVVAMMAVAVVAVAVA
jgi:hypothetical protein